LVKQEINLEQALSLIENSQSRERIMRLHPEARLYFALLVLELEKYQRDNNLGGYFIIVDNYRGEADQNKAFANEASNAKYGKSWHNYGMAVDIYFFSGEYDPNKPFTFEGAISLPSAVSKDWYNGIEILSTIGEKFGMEYGGTWSGKNSDPPHFEFNGGLGTNAKDVIPKDFKLSDDTYLKTPLPPNFTFPQIPKYGEYLPKNEAK